MADREEPVSWLFSHRELLVVVFAAVLWLFNRVAQGRRSGGAPRAGPEDADAARTRRVQEEVQRKIAERARARAAEAAPAPAMAPGTVPEEPAEPEPPLVFEAPRIEVEESPPPAREAAEVLPMPDNLIEELRALEAVRASTLATAKAATAAGPTARAAQESGLLGELRTPDRLRRAILLREILGPPVGLKPGSANFF